MGQRRNGSRRRRIAAGVVAATVLPSALPHTASALDLTVSNVEVTQGSQLPTNAILLVARRGTAVRATVAISLNSGEVKPNNVTGRLHVFRNGVELTSPAGRPPVAMPFDEPLVPDRNMETHTLNFELPAPTFITSTNDLDVRVDVTPVVGETSTTNNSGFANDLKVESRKTPRIFFARVNFLPNGRGLPQTSLVRQGVGDMFVRGILPFNDADPKLYNPMPVSPTMNFGFDINGNNQLDGLDGSLLLADLGARRQLLAFFPFLFPGGAGIGVPADSYVYGWLEGPVSGNGLGMINGRAAFGNTEDERYQGSFAHEFTHNLGFNHITQTIDQTGWDVGARLLNNPSGNLVAQRAMPSTLNDVQVAGLLTAQRWVAWSKYLVLLGNPAFRSAPARAAAATPIRPSRRVAVLHGIFNEAGTRLLELRPVFRYPWLSEPVPTDPDGPFVAELRTTSGEITRVPFNAVVGDDQEAGVHQKQGFFEVMVPVRGELSRVRITSRDGRRRFGQLTSSRPPKLRISSPQPDTTIGGIHTVRWTVTDPDTPGSRLRYQVAFSRDGGRSFAPVAVNLKSRKAAFDTRLASAREGKGVLRVFVSDGLNTRFHDVRGLTLRK